jgi:hypothetical protein
MTSSSSTNSQSSTKPFLGKLQPVSSRLPAIPQVNYARGGSDFRCPQNVSSLGRQVLSGDHRATQPVVKFGGGSRFNSSETLGVGPAALGQMSSMRKQPLSNRKSAESVTFGTSSRDGAWKLYAIYTAKRF